MKHAFSTLALLIGITTSAQTDVKLPDFLPPTPDVGAIIKNGNLSANPHSGAATAGIPLHAIQVRDFTLPISVNYATSGFKPDEIPSRVGIGWNLNAGGVISRIVRGKPDDGTITPPPPPMSDFYTYPNSLMNYLASVTDPTSAFDTQPDEYRFNVNGISGKFFILRDGSILSIPFSNNKVNVDHNNNSVTSVIITNDKGIKYIFSGYGTVIEKTITHSMTGGNLRNSEIKTSWFLTRILLPTGEFIDFKYLPVIIQTITGKSSMIRRDIQTNSPCPSEATCPVGVTYTTNISQAKYQSYFLDKIEASTGSWIKFNYEARPDISGDVRLKSVDVWNNFVSRQIKKIDFFYQDQGTAQSHRRFFLKEVTFINPLNTTDRQAYRFEYNEQNNVPERFSAPTDHMGYANMMGGASSQDFIQVLSEDDHFADEINKRQPNGNAAQKGLLKKIIYPTGGFDEFHYEPNQLTYWDNVRLPDMQNRHVEGVGGYPSSTYSTAYFTPAYTQNAEFYGSTWYASTPAPGGESIIAFVRLIRVDNNSILHQWTLRGYTGFPGFSGNIPNRILVEGGVTYRIEIEVRNGSLNAAKVDIVYDVSNSTVFKEIKEELCGVRVKRIIAFDPLTDKQTSKNYLYRSLTDTVGVLNASARKMYFTTYLSNAETYKPCPEGASPSVGVYAHMICNAKVFSVNSTNVIEVNDAGGVVYTYVIESDDEYFTNGCIEHKFNQQGSMAAGPVLNGPIPDGPLNPYNYGNGLELQTRYFNSQRQLVRKIENSYGLDPRLGDKHQLSNFIIRKRYDPDITYPLTAQSFAHFDVEQYGIYTAWHHLNYTEITDYDVVKGTALTSRINYSYSPQLTSTPLHTNISRTETKGSDGLVSAEIKKYAPDFIGSPELSALAAKNQIADVIETELWKNVSFLSKTQTSFVDVGTITTGLPLNTYYAPDKIKQQIGNSSLESKLRFYKYDNNLNLLEASKENDVRMAYIWDYNNKLAIAEISNAGYNEGFAFTSFEADGPGGWQINGNSLINNAFTGFKSFALSASNFLRKSELVANTGFLYIVSYWARDGIVEVNGGTEPPLITKNGWSFYKHILPADELQSISITGTAAIDEVRLYPQKALMKSYTYLPDVGVVSINDANDQVARYEYDGFNRLVRIRDVENNIVKQVEYNYGETVSPCTTPNGNWIFTGNTRCAKNNPFNNANTGLQEREERDLNNCSATYLQTRWTSLASSSLCPAEVCTGQYVRMINGVCTPGTKTLIKSSYLGDLQWECTYEYSWSDGYKWIGTQSQNHYCSPVAQQ